MTHLFLNDPNAQDVKEQFNVSQPSDDTDHFSKLIADFTEKMTRLAGATDEPADYAKKISGRLCPVVLPYELGTPAEFSQAKFNGRPLNDDVMDVMLSLASNKQITDGASPDQNRIRREFPHYGDPYTNEEQLGVTPVARPSRK
jgi:hypothetical protein